MVSISAIVGGCRYLIDRNTSLAIAELKSAEEVIVLGETTMNHEHDDPDS